MSLRFLGKKPARHAIKLKLGDYVDLSGLPALPPTFGHVTSNSVEWGMLANDKCGNCVWAGAAHETMAYAMAQKRTLPRFIDDVIVRQYGEQTGYVPGQDATDQGTDMQAAASYRRNNGLRDADGNLHKVKAYAEIPVGSVKGMQLLLHAVHLFGAAGLGIQLPSSAMDQFDSQQPWTPVRGARNEGGHYVSVVGRNSRGNVMLVTWGRLQAATPAFLDQYADEAVAYFSEEYLNAQGISPEMVDSTRLNDDLAKIGA